MIEQKVKQRLMISRMFNNSWFYKLLKLYPEVFKKEVGLQRSTSSLTGVVELANKSSYFYFSKQNLPLEL